MVAQQRVWVSVSAVLLPSPLSVLLFCRESFLGGSSSGGGKFTLMFILLRWDVGRLGGGSVG